MPAAGSRGPSRAAGARRVPFGIALGAALLLLLLWSAVALAATPLPEPSVLVPGDPRSEGEGPGLIGSPIAVAIGVVVLGVLAAAGTLVVVRLTRDD